MIEKMTEEKDEKLVQELRKEISREEPPKIMSPMPTVVSEESNYTEIIKVHVIKKKLFYKGDIQFLQDYMDNEDDYEMLYNNGFLFDFDEIIGLDIDKFIKFINTYLDDNEDDKENDPQYTFFQGFKEILEPYKGYTIFFDED